MNSLRSTASPSSNEFEFTAASMHWMLASGAAKPRNLRALALRKLAKISGWPLAASSLLLFSLIFTSGLLSATHLLAKASAPSFSLPSSTSSSTRPSLAASGAGT